MRTYCLGQGCDACWFAPSDACSRLCPAAAISAAAAVAGLSSAVMPRSCRLLFWPDTDLKARMHRVRAVNEVLQCRHAVRG